MKFYTELTIVNSTNISFSVAWSKLFTQLHLAFVEQKDANEQIPYGVSFPEYKSVEVKGKQIMLLGSKLRVFANSADELEKLNLDKWLERFTDYVHIKSAKQVDHITHFLTVNRYRPQASAENLARRYASRHNVSVEDALKRLEGFKQKLEPYPYIQLKSLSGAREFSLCVKQTTVEQSKAGKFSTYGLSATSTVPHW
ncbi:MAG: type I-F CRISPR-associated endoribonuclease Cas6/Csy4 [Methylotenera sp.]|nr:type I-F CRISPR-associated endoribonuclease Cas6/Csy4 [Methylotenera sp.]